MKDENVKQLNQGIDVLEDALLNTSLLGDGTVFKHVYLVTIAELKRRRDVLIEAEKDAILQRAKVNAETVDPFAY